MNKSAQGRRNRQRGLELQRQAVNIAREYGLTAQNRDRGGAQCPEGDIEVEGVFLGCKRKKTVPAYLLPEKMESGVVWRPDGLKPLITIPFRDWCWLRHQIKESRKSLGDDRPF